MSATPRQYPAQRGYSDDLGWHWLLFGDEPGVVIGVLLEGNGMQGKVEMQLIDAIARLGIEPAKLEAKVGALVEAAVPIDDALADLGYNDEEDDDDSAWGEPWITWRQIKTFRAALIPFRKEASDDTDG